MTTETLPIDRPTHHIHPAELPGHLVQAGAEPIVQATAIEKYFGSNHVLRGCSMTVFPRETIPILGRSGSGKSTFLRCLNFLEEPSAGVVEIDENAVDARPFGGGSRDRRDPAPRPPAPAGEGL